MSTFIADQAADIAAALKQIEEEKARVRETIRSDTPVDQTYPKPTTDTGASIWGGMFNPGGFMGFDYPHAR